MSYKEQINKLIKSWKKPEDPDLVHRLFETFKEFVYDYVKNSPLDTKNIITIIKDFRTYINPDEEPSIYYFTDLICDHILLSHKGIDNRQLPVMFLYIKECEDQV
jgi:hypothetical protein